MRNTCYALDGRPAQFVRMGDIPSLGRFRLNPNGKCRPTEDMAFEPANRRDFLKVTGAVTIGAMLPELAAAAADPGASRLFPTELPGRDWVQFRAAGFTDPVCGVIYRRNDPLTNGMALGGVDTGCIDVESNGLLGYCTIFNSHVPRRGPIHLPFLALAVGGKTWALCCPPGDGAVGEVLSRHVSNWLPGDLGADQPAWKSREGDVPGWFKSQGRGKWDLPAGRVGCHTATTLRWTSPIAGEIQIEGGLWQARNFGRDQHWELVRNATSLASGTLHWGPSSAKPLSIAPDSGGNTGLTLRVDEGDAIELCLGESSSGDFVGVDLTIRTASGDQVWDLAKDWSDNHNPNGPWTYDFHRGARFAMGSLPLREAGVGTASEIHYWGHYPVLDMEFELDAPVGVGLRAWSPFLPGSVVDSMLPGIVFEMHLRNESGTPQTGTVGLTFPGPSPAEAGSKAFTRRETSEPFRGVSVQGEKASYALSVLGQEHLRLGGELGTDRTAWANFGRTLPGESAQQPGACAAVDFSLRSGETKIVRFVLTWHAPTWKGGGVNVSTSGNTFKHMYAKHYPDATKAAAALAQWHQSLLRRTLAWQQVIYTDQKLPLWLRDSLINILYCITEDGLWAQRDETLLPWVTEEDGLFGLIECPRCCPQIECIPCSFYGSQPLVYFFPELQLSTMRGYKHYQGDDGRPAWIFGPTAEMAAPNYTQYQASTNGISLAAVIHRFLLCRDTPDGEIAKEFYPVIKKTMEYNVNLGIKGNPNYSLGEQVIAMPNVEGNLEWFETQEPGWTGIAAHIGILRLAQLGISEHLAKQAGDAAFAQQCAEWNHLASDALEKCLWDPRGYYLNWYEPASGKKSELIFGYQLDGEWVLDHHGLKSPLPVDRVRTVLNTIRKANVAVTKFGAVNYVEPDGAVANPGGYGSYSYFPPEALMLAMNYIYEGQREFGVELARKVWHNFFCKQGYTWDVPNIMRGDSDTGERTFGSDYYQDMMLWSLPAALDGKDFSAPTRPGGLVDRILKAASRSDES
jgi:uncharacterized protein (DUF608 family)